MTVFADRKPRCKLATAGDRDVGSFVREVLETRLDAIEKSFEVFQADLRRVPTDVDKQVSQLKELHEEKFFRVAKIFDERTVLRTQSFDAANATMMNALAYMKEATLKTESNITKEIEGLKMLFNKSIESSDEKISDTKNRLTLIEGKNTGMGTIVSVGVSVVMMMIALASATIAFSRNNGNSNNELVARGSIAAQTAPVSVTPAR